MDNNVKPKPVPSAWGNDISAYQDLPQAMHQQNLSHTQSHRMAAYCPQGELRVFFLPEIEGMPFQNRSASCCQDHTKHGMPRSDAHCSRYSRHSIAHFPVQGN